MDDSFEVPNFEQYLLVKDTTFSNALVTVNAVAGFGNGNLMYYNIQIKASEQSQNLYIIQQRILFAVKAMLKQERWVAFSETEYENREKSIRLTIRHDLSALRIIELTYRGGNWPV